jgi:adenine-specific DNA methylase
MTDTQPRVLMEDWLPVAELGIESRREAAPIPGQFPKLKTLHQWWARRPIVASAATVLGGILPAWSQDLADTFQDLPQLQTEKAYRLWFLGLVGIWGDPIEAKRQSDAAKAAGVKLKENPYTYRPAFKNSVDERAITMLHQVLIHTWGVLPVVADVTAGGGSIPWASVRYGLPTHANDLNSVAATVLAASLEIPVRYGTELSPLLRQWGELLVERASKRLLPYFPVSPNETVTNYLFANAISCPRTGRLVPLMPDWRLREGKKPAAVRMITQIAGVQLDVPRFQVVHGDDVDFDANKGLFAAGRATSPYDNLVIDGDYIKAEAKAGRMTQVLYAVVVNSKAGKTFRSPTEADLTALGNAEREVVASLPRWLAENVIPDTDIPAASNYDRGHRMYGINKWSDFFAPRQLLTHALFVEEFRILVPEIRAALGVDLADAVLTELALMQGKGLNYNARQATWDVGRQKTRSVFEKHNFAFKWTFVEFPGPVELLPWCLSQLVDAYDEIARLLEETGRAPMSESTLKREVTVTHGNAADLESVADASVHHVCMDPPYYANVMYSELSNFFYAWERLTLGLIRPEMFAAESTDLDNEAVTNLARFAVMGKRRRELADLDYEAKMAAIFSECRRVIVDNGVLTVMFTNKDARAWDALGSALITAGFVVETSWPVATESEASSHQANKNAAESTIMLVCRKRIAGETKKRFLDDIAADIRDAARAASVKFEADGIEGVDLLLSTYGPALSVLSSNWPVYSSAPNVDGHEQLLRPEEALNLAREEVVRLRRTRLIGKSAQIDDLTDFVLMAWDIFGAREFTFDTARLLALAVGGLEVDDLVRAKVLSKKTGTVVLLEPSERVRHDADSHLPGVRPEASKFDHMVDAVDTIVYVAQHDGSAAAKRLLEKHGFVNDESFLATVQGLVNVIPRSKIKGAWVVPEAGLLDMLVTAYLPSVTLPAEPVAAPEAEQGAFDLG